MSPSRKNISIFSDFYSNSIVFLPHCKTLPNGQKKKSPVSGTLWPRSCVWHPRAVPSHPLLNRTAQLPARSAEERAPCDGLQQLPSHHARGACRPLVLPCPSAALLRTPFFPGFRFCGFTIINYHGQYLCPPLPSPLPRSPSSALSPPAGVPRCPLSLAPTFPTSTCSHPAAVCRWRPRLRSAWPPAEPVSGCCRPVPTG